MHGLTKHYLSQEEKVFLNYQQMVEVSGSLFTFLSFSLLVTVLNNPKEIFVILLYFPSFTQIQISSVAELLC